LRDAALRINVHEMPEEDVAYEINRLAGIVADLAAMVARIAGGRAMTSPREIQIECEGPEGLYWLRAIRPEPTHDLLESARCDAWEARAIACNLAPLNTDAAHELAKVVDELANSVHVLTTAVLRLCDQIEQGKGR
jgi:hypothetical protein